MDKQNKLGIDLHQKDSLLAGFSFEDVIDMCNCNLEKVNPETVREEINALVEAQLRDMRSLLLSNMDEIVRRIKEGREC